MAEWIALTELAVRPRPGRDWAQAADRLVDHAEFRRQAAAWRAAFAGCPGERVALHFEDTATFLAALYGAWHAGKIAYLCADALPETLASLSDGVDGFAGDFPSQCAPLTACANACDDGHEWAPLDAQATCLRVYTSGSTGAAVAIEKRLSQLAREVDALQQVFGERLAGTRVHGTVSHQHIYGLLFRALWPLAAGRVIAPRRFFLEDIAATLDGPATLVCSPAHLKRLPAGLDTPWLQQQVRAVFSSGGALPADAAADASCKLGQAPIEVFGSSETGGIAWRQTPAQTWTPLPEVRWRIVDAQLEVASPHLPDAHWCRTADRAQAVAGGFQLLGRADRIVKVEERRVSLTALERHLLALPEVAEARVLLLQGTRAELAAVVVPSAQGQAQLHASGRRALGLALGRGLAHSQDAVTRPRRWRFVSALPMNAQGKTTEAALQALFRPQRPTPHWLQREALQARLELFIAPELIVFDGHFPQTPILPGVAQLDWALRFGREAFALPARFVRMEALKFQRTVRPGARIELQLEWLPEKSALVFHYQSEQGPHASGRAVFADATDADA